MKTIFTSFALTIVTIAAKAQIHKGQFLAGGNVAFSSSKAGGIPATNYTSSVFQVLPGIGYFVINNLALGLRSGLSFYKSSDTYSPFTNKSTIIKLSPFVRYYFLKPTQKVNVLADISYDHDITKSKFVSGGGTSESTLKTNGYSFSAGPAFFINKYIAVEFLAGYIHSKQSDINNYNNTFNTTVGFQIHLGK
jgi:hypothetical protein